MSPVFEHDVLIIGSGAAGLAVALQLPSELSIALLSKTSIKSGSTLWAQGGIAAVLDGEDSIESHISDTLIAGAGLCQKPAVRQTVENGPDAIRWLIQQGVAFDVENSDPQEQKFHLTKEGGHSHRRILHSADATGQVLSGSLVDRVMEKSNITTYENRVGIDLVTHNKLSLPGNRCVGAYVLNNSNDRAEVFRARAVVLATGGSSKVYLYTSNPDVSTGDGIAMAWRAGCRIGNMEFNQFHPTCLYHPQAKSFLISEAVRGEGGILLLPDGQRFMDQFDARAELAPRDIVARAIDHEMKRLGSDCLYLDISHKSDQFIEHHFPTILERCQQYQIDIRKDPIPVVPAAHYTCGGIVTDLNARTDITSLYAVGETAFSGLHGANRMASNSLLECLVFAQTCAKDIIQRLDISPPPPTIPKWDESQVTDSDEDVVISHNWDELRRFMWDYVGIVRTDKRLQRAKRRVDLLHQEINEYYSNYKVSNDLLELRNLVTVADLIICSAIQRKESRGLHFTMDYPEQADKTCDTILTPVNFSSQGWH